MSDTAGPPRACRGGWPGPRKETAWTFKPDPAAIDAVERYMEAHSLVNEWGGRTKALNAMLATHPAARTAAPHRHRGAPAMTVAEHEVTCFACPTQIVGALEDGRRFYFRYRWGVASLRISSPSGEEIEGAYTDEHLGSDMDGFLPEGEALELVERLASRIDVPAGEVRS